MGSQATVCTACASVPQSTNQGGLPVQVGLLAHPSACLPALPHGVQELRASGMDQQQLDAQRAATQAQLDSLRAAAGQQQPER